MNLFITGTDTDVGKTIVTAGVAAVMQSLGYIIGVYKPVQSGSVKHKGFLISPDLKFTKSIDPNIKTKCSYTLYHPVAPSLAAKVENVKINTKAILNDYLSLKASCDIVLVEGAGGLMVPICDNFLMADMAKMLQLPVVIVARPDLGTINHTLLTINAAKHAGLRVIGVIINNYPVGTKDLAIKEAPAIIEELSGVKILGIIPKLEIFNSSFNPESLLDAIINNVDLQKMFNIQIPKLSQL